MRVIILGFDGLDYNRIQKYMDALPTFKGLRGFIGRLESTIPPSTAPAWVSMFTGKTPAEHGIYGFINIETRKVMNYSDIRSKKLWDYLKDLRFCIVNVPMTYPPDKNINGLMVSGFPVPTNRYEKIVYPRKWAHVLKNRIGLPKDVDEVEFRRRYYQDKERAFEHLLDLMDRRAEAYLRLLRLGKFDIFWFVFRETDVIQHFYRDEMKILRGYKKVDEILLKFLGELKDDDWIITTSDHGQNTVEKVVYVDNLLKSVFAGNSVSFKGRIIRLLAQLSWRYPSLRKTLQYTKKILFSWNKEIMIPKVAEGLIYNSDSWSISVRDKNLKNVIIDALKNFKIHGKKAFLHAYDSEELYRNAHIKLPDIFIIPNYGFYPLSGAKFGRDEVAGPPLDPSHNGTHTLNGVYSIYNKRNEKKLKTFVDRERKVWDIPEIVVKIFE